MEGGTAGDWGRFRRAFFEAYLRNEPEEATSLGYPGLDDQLKDTSPGALGDELSFYRRAAAELEATPTASLSEDARIDHRVLWGLVRFQLRAHERRGAPLANLELGSYPYAILQLQLGLVCGPGDLAPIAARAAEIPRFLSQQEANLRSGLAAGLLPDRAITAFFAEQELPEIARSFDELGRSAHARFRADPGAGRRLGEASNAARDAYAAHARFLRDEMLPRAGERFAIGEAEYGLRLSENLALDVDPEELVREARAVLESTQAQIIELASRLRVGASAAPVRVASMQDARRVFLELLSAVPGSAEEIAALYEERLERATALVRERRLFEIPDSLRLTIAPLPPGVAHGSNLINWPAPLFDRRRAGQVLHSPDPSAHPLVGAANLSVHEGIPGHFLQSLRWQGLFGSDPGPVRFLLVADPVAMARNSYGPMLNIEGFAAYAEELMRAEGFYTPEETLFALVGRAIRAVRVIVDIGLHTLAMTTEHATRFLVDEAAMPEGWARGQVLRYARIPMQAITYLVGCLEIERLKREVRVAQGTEFDERSFHERLLSFGPVPPALLRAPLMAALTRSSERRR